MSHDPDALYGIARPRRRPEHELSNSTSTAFSSQLSTILSESRNGKFTGSGRVRSAQSIKPRKDDIFSAHRAKKRSAAEASKDDSGRIHQTQDVIGGVDEEVLRRSKRRMEEKARIYAAMKRGDYVDPKKKRYINDEDRGPLVDFDKKWAEAQGNSASDEDSSADEDEDGSEDDEVVEYTDEYGRLRRGSKAQLAREERRRRIQSNAAEELDELSARPKMPSNLLYGDTVQSSAYNPDAAVERQMEELAARRDRSATPPEETHYDASKEIRSKGVGFYQFSKDNESRKKEMEDLGESRKRTEQWEQERRQNREKKEKDMDEALRGEKMRKSERDANAFLKSLGSDLGVGFVPAGQADLQEASSKKKVKKGWGK